MDDYEREKPRHRRDRDRDRSADQDDRDKDRRRRSRDRSDKPREKQRRHRDRDHKRSRSQSRSRSPESSRRRERNISEDRDRDRRRRRSREERNSHRRHQRHRSLPSDEDEALAAGAPPRRRRIRDGDPARSPRPSPKPTAQPPSPLRRGAPLPSQDDSFALAKGDEPPKPKEKPNFGNTGLLAAASNSVAQADGTAITLKYHEPPEARKPPPRDQWKLFVFKGSDVVDTVDLAARSCWLVGRDAAVVDLLAEHPSVSKQHAVVQFRHVEKRNEFGDRIGRVRPYLIDLESANGTILNGDKVPDSRYLELREKDVVQFGHSSREYVVMLSRD